MKWMGVNELREKFLSFFESKGHYRLPSFPLLPQDDNSLLLINSGMAPMKKYFLGQATPPSKRVTTCQKCVRTPDIERVGKTSRHGTYFEMLGNFSFGDYFKHEATKWAWEFITKEMEIPVDRLYVTVFETDDEAENIWVNEVGVPKDHMRRLGREDNFWEIGSGPCGPCSEIYFDRGPEYSCGSPICDVGCDCDRYVEFWNLVFSQYDTDGEGHYTPMEHPNIDTGMGLERLACIMQGVHNLFEVDTVQNIMKHISRIAGVTYGENEKQDVSLRVITDHIRSTTFLIADGIMPSNEGRGYVLKRLLRRAARHGRLLGIHEPFLYKVADTVIHENESAYPELVEKAEYIKRIIRIQEESFAKTIDKGMDMLAEITAKMDAPDYSGERKLTGEQAFRLYDTFGFPIDLTREILAEKNVEIDEEGFEELMRASRARNREITKSQDVAWIEESIDLKGEAPTRFVGYETLSCDASVLHILCNGEAAEDASAGDEISFVLDTTPFYAESGGQVGDTGCFRTEDAVLRVTDTKKLPSGHTLHTAKVESGYIAVGAQGKAEVDVERRHSIMRNHTAAHLLHAALRKVLGDHVHQAGQLVNEQRCRFDFSHFSAMTAEELREVERLVNEAILADIPVSCTEHSISEAREMGAMALFGEKYGDIVRVVDIPGTSMELCGGTHVSNTGKLGLCRILSESSVAAGVRRIELATGRGVLEFMDEQQSLIHSASAALKLNNPNELTAKIETLTAEHKETERQLASLRSKLADVQLDEMYKKAEQVGGLCFYSASLSGADVDAMRSMADKIRDHAPNGVAALSCVVGEKAMLVVCCGKDALAHGMHAGKIVKEALAVSGGSGGGKPDMAMGGTAQKDKVGDSVAVVPEIMRKLMK